MSRKRIKREIEQELARLRDRGVTAWRDVVAAVRRNPRSPLRSYLAALPVEAARPKTVRVIVQRLPDIVRPAYTVVLPIAKRKRRKKTRAR